MGRQTAQVDYLSQVNQLHVFQSHVQLAIPVLRAVLLFLLKIMLISRAP